MDILIGLILLVLFLFLLRGAFLVVQDKQAKWELNKKSKSNKKRGSNEGKAKYKR
jgi:hypothetical protein